MKINTKPVVRKVGHPAFFFLLSFIAVPMTSLAQSSAMLSTEISMTSKIIIGTILLLSAIFLFLLKRKLNSVASTLQDVTEELGSTRKRLVDTSSELEQSTTAHQATNKRYQGILFEANVGMFQMDLNGSCTFINTALQELSGLYPKKAMNEGLIGAVHPDDREGWSTAWNAFVQANEAFNHVFRFRLSNGAHSHVVCRANKVLNDKNEVESYIGWISDVTRFHEAKLAQQAITNRYDYFVSETVEGYYQLTPESPIPLSSSSAKMAEALMTGLKLTECNDTFATLYGSKPSELLGNPLCDLLGGCGPFKNTESFSRFIESDFKIVDLEIVRQDPTGNRLNLMNSVVGIVEDNKLVGVWGTQRNITTQKREKAALTSQVQFMHRILDALPADVHVKDTRCRYMYASKKLAQRTGISQEEWIGKTILEVIPGAAHDLDQTAIDTMKSKKMMRAERPYEARGKSGWMETIQIPLVSDDGLVEGVVGLSLEISDRKRKEDAAARLHKQIDLQLQDTRKELTNSQDERSKAAVALANANQKLRISDTEKVNREHEYKEHLAERKRAEETLRRSEQGLLERQQQLNKQLSERTEELHAETDKRKKWEELLSIKEDELSKIEMHASRLDEFYEQEITRREQAEAGLAASESSLEKLRHDLEELTANHEQELNKLNSNLTDKVENEQKGRAKAERDLKQLTTLLERTQEQLSTMTEQHANELEKEVKERKAAAEKLILSMDELDLLKQEFNQRMEEETKSIKQELAKKQIREKSLRQHEKDLEGRIKELEELLRMKAIDFAEQLQAREGAEVQKQQIEEKMEQLTQRQQDLISRETQKLNLGIATIRLDEVKLRKRAGDLEREKEQLEEKLQAQNLELENAGGQLKRTEAILVETQNQLKQLTGDQAKVISKETEALRQQMTDLEKTSNGLHEQLVDLSQQKVLIEKDLETRNNDLTNAAREYRKVVDAYKGSQDKIKQLSEDQESVIARHTKELNVELEHLKATEAKLNAREQELQVRIKEQQQNLETYAEKLKAENANRIAAQKALKELQVAFAASQENAEDFVHTQTEELTRQIEAFKNNETVLKDKLNDVENKLIERDGILTDVKLKREETAALLKDAEQRLTTITEDHQADLKKSLAEVAEVSRMNSSLVEELDHTVQETLNPVVRTTLIMEKAKNITDEQKRDLVHANISCRTLIDTMNYRKELTHLADGQDEINNNQFDLHTLMADIDRQFSHRAETKKLFFAVSFAQYQTANNVPKLIETDDAKLRNILSIMLGYAIDRTAKGRIGLHATRKSSEAPSTRIAFELTYTAAEQEDLLLSNVFNAADEETTDLKYGLTLARRYISMLGGHFHLEQRDAGITALTVDVPYKRVNSDSAATSGDLDEKQAGAA